MSTTFDSCVRNLINVCYKVQDGFAALRGKSSPNWATPLGKFASVYEKAADPEKFISMFTAFAKSYSSQYSAPIFEGAKVNDAFFKNEEVFKGPGDSAQPTGWAARTVLKGPVIYLGDDEKFKVINIPIGEIFRAAMELYEKNKDNSNSALPAKVLQAFYCLMAKVDETSQANADLLTKFLEDEKEGASEVKQDSGLFAMLPGLLNGFLPQGMSGENVVAGLGKMLNSSAVDEIGGTVKQVISQVQSGMQKDGNGSVQDSIKGFLEVLGTPEVKDSLTRFGEQVTSLTTGVLSPPTSQISPSEVAPSSQD